MLTQQRFDELIAEMEDNLALGQTDNPDGHLYHTDTQPGLGAPIQSYIEAEIGCLEFQFPSGGNPAWAGNLWRFAVDETADEAGRRDALKRTRRVYGAVNTSALENARGTLKLRGKRGALLANLNRTQPEDDK